MEYLKRFVLWFLSGAGFTLGVVLVAAGAMNGDKLFRGGQPTFEEVEAAAVTFSNVQPVTVTRHFALTGTVTNKSTSSVEVTAEVSLLKDGKVVYVCRDYIHNVPAAGASRRFQIDCKDVVRSPDLEGVAFNIGATSVTRARQVVLNPK